MAQQQFMKGTDGVVGSVEIGTNVSAPGKRIRRHARSERPLHTGAADQDIQLRPGRGDFAAEA